MCQKITNPIRQNLGFSTLNPVSEFLVFQYFILNVTESPFFLCEYVPDSICDENSDMVPLKNEVANILIADLSN